MDHETTPRNEGWWIGFKDFLIMHSVSFLFEKTFSLCRSGSIRLWIPWFWDQTLPARSTHQSKAATKNCLPRSIFSLEKNRLRSIFVRPFDNVARHSRVIEDGRQLDWSDLWACWSNKMITVLESTNVKIIDLFCAIVVFSVSRPPPSNGVWTKFSWFGKNSKNKVMLQGAASLIYTISSWSQTIS